MTSLINHGYFGGLIVYYNSVLKYIFIVIINNFPCGEDLNEKIFSVAGHF